MTSIARQHLSCFKLLSMKSINSKRLIRLNLFKEMKVACLIKLRNDKTVLERSYSCSVIVRRERADIRLGGVDIIESNNRLISTHN